MEDVDLVAGPAEVGERPVHHVLRLRVPVDGYEDLAQRWLALLAGVGVLRSLLSGGGEGIERKGQGVPVEGMGSAGTHVERHGDLGSLERLARALLLLGLHGPDHDALEGCVRVRSRLWLRLRVMYRPDISSLSFVSSEKVFRATTERPRLRAPLFTFDAAMETRSKRRKTEPVADKIRCGEISVVVAIAEELPDLFTAEILPKLDVISTLNLAQVSKWCRDVVWSVGGVRSLEAKLKVYAERNLEHPSSWLSYAACFGNIPAIKALLESGVDANKSCTSPENLPLYSGPIHLAAECGHSMIVKVLIDAGVDVNKRSTMSDSKGTKLISNVTALNVAATWDHAPVVMELVKAGADVNIADDQGRTPIYNAAEFGYDDCVALLVAYDADINIADKDGNTPMKRALKNDHEKVVKLLKHVEARNRV